MEISSARDQAIDYAPCRYNGSRLWFRGPRKALRPPYVVCLGGSGVYGRYVDRPWTAALETQIGCTVVNLGVENAGIDAYLSDPGALVTAANAQVVVIQLTCSHNTSNRFYSVHPRRNDRFLKASEALTALYPEMDFTEVHFTRHLLARLRSICPERFNVVAREARCAWQARMRNLIGQMNGAVFLLWFDSSPLSETVAFSPEGEPFLTRSAITPLDPHVRAILEVVPSDWRAGQEDMRVPSLELARAEHLPGPAAHDAVARLVAHAIIPALQ
ncbi:DUF6473 family protein [Marivita sp.]|uniref:DUF6473 family protein n=1 Tax=Marivita sp. TaxID=2003365 RepID=UPI003F6F0554